MGKFFLGALVGSGLTGGLGAWLAGQVTVSAPPTIENRKLTQELNRARADLLAVEIERDRIVLLARVLIDVIARASRAEHGPGALISSEE